MHSKIAQILSSNEQITQVLIPSIDASIYDRFRLVALVEKLMQFFSFSG